MVQHSMILKFLILIYSFFLGSGFLFAASIQIQVDRNNISMEEELSVQVIVAGARDLDQIPEILNTQNFEITEGGTSSQITVINGSTAIQKVFHFTLFPKRAGIFTLGPARIDYNGQLLVSDVVKIRIEHPDRPTEKAEPTKPYYIESTVDNKNPYVGEQVVYTFRLHRRVNGKIAQDTLPDFEGFWKEEMGDAKEYRTKRNGVPWIVSEFKIAIYPNSAGPQTISPVVIVMDVLTEGRKRRGNSYRGGIGAFFEDDSFFGRVSRKRVRLTAPAIEVNVRSLPTENIPENFSGIVGKVSIKAKMNKSNIKVGESSTLTIFIRSDGNLRRMHDFDVTWPDVKTYDDKPKLEIEKSTRLQMIKILKKAIVPQRAGELHLPAISLSYFDPNSGSFRKVISKKIVMNVAPGDEKNLYVPGKMQHVGTDKSITNHKKNIKILGKDLVGIERESSTLSPEIITLKEYLMALILLLLGPIGYFVIKKNQDRNHLMKNNKTYVEQLKAYKTFKSDIKELSQNGNFHSEASKAMRNYIGRKLGLEGSSIMPIDADRVLAPKGVERQIITEVKEFLSSCDVAQYGGNSKIDRNEIKNIKQQMESIAKNFERKF
ncbi:BatD family protein [Bacteriovoracaceae bacterium]|nr:BatD family protein [Bacteriovoracaceae bacterium]